MKSKRPSFISVNISISGLDERVEVAIIVITGAILIVGIVVLSYFGYVLICRRRANPYLFSLPNLSADRSNLSLAQSPQIVDPITTVSPWTFGERSSVVTATNLPYFDDLQNAIMPLSFGYGAALPRDNLWGFGTTYPWQVSVWSCIG